MRNACVEDTSVAELEDQVDCKKLKELLKNQKLIRKTYPSVECREQIKRAPCGKILEHGIELVKNGDKVYYKKIGEEK